MEKRKSLMKVNSVYGLLLAVQSGVGLAALPDYIAHNVPNIVLKFFLNVEETQQKLILFILHL